METATAVNTKTHRRLRKAYCRIIKEKGEDKVNVSSLTEEADVSRATFYLYYQNIEEFEEDTAKYVSLLFIKQLRLFITSANLEELKQVTKRKNLIFTDDDFELFACLFPKSKGFNINSKIFNFLFDNFFENISNYFDEKYVKKNRDKFDLFYIGFCGVMRENFLDYHADKVYRDILRTVEIWEILFPDYKRKD